MVEQRKGHTVALMFASDSGVYGFYGLIIAIELLLIMVSRFLILP